MRFGIDSYEYRASADERDGSMTEESGTPATARPRLLAIDDARDSAELISRVAERCGYEARHITDPTDVAESIREWQPSVVVTDICMPQMDAIEMLGVLEQSGFDGDLVIVSGQDEMLRSQASKLAGVRRLKVVANLQKPIDIKSFRALLSDRLKAKATA